MRLAILAVTFLFISPLVFANEAENDIKLTVLEVREAGEAEGRLGLQILTRVKSGFLKNALRKKIQISRAEDDLGTDLAPKEFDKSDDSFSAINKKDDTTALITIELKSPPREARQIKKIEGILELYIPELDPDAEFILSNFSEKLKSGSYFEENIFASNPQTPPQFLEDTISIRATYGLSSSAGHITNVEIKDKNKKIMAVIFFDKTGKKKMPDAGGWLKDRTVLKYDFNVPPTEIADLVFYLKTYKVVKIIPLEYNNIPLPQ